MVQPLAIGTAALAGQALSADAQLPDVAGITSAQTINLSQGTGNQATGSGQQNDTSHSPYPSSTIEQTLEHLNREMQAWATGMRFDIDEDVQRVVISIIDTASGEVLRTVPSDAVLRIAKMIMQFQGNTVNTKA